jgi:adenylate kinase
LRAHLAEKGTPLVAVLELSIDNAEILSRLSSRRTCKECGLPTVATDKCPICGAAVYQREDDKEEVITRRLQVYEEQTAPIISFYRNEALLITVSATGSVEEITQRAISALSHVS